MHDFQVKLEKLVKPNKTISDYRTEITGVSDEDLVGVKCSLVDIQVAVVVLSYCYRVRFYSKLTTFCRGL